MISIAILLLIIAIIYFKNNKFEKNENYNTIKKPEPVLMKSKIIQEESEEEKAARIQRRKDKEDPTQFMPK